MRIPPPLLVLPLLAAACGPAGFAGDALVYVRNAQGSVVAAVDGQGRAVWRTHDDAYGLRLWSSGTPVPREFIDQPLDEETGFYQFHYRSYDPATAQWLQPDPKLQLEPDACASQPQDCNPYAYAGDRPEEWIDPDGRWVQNNVAIDGELYTVMTVAFIGPGAAETEASTAARIVEWNAVPGNQKVLIFSTSVDKASDAPASYTRVELAPTEPGPSTTDRATSTVTLRADAFQPTADRGTVALHELLHVAGADDAYAASQRGSQRVTTPKPGTQDDFMATLSGTQLDGEELHEMTAAQANGELNQGIETPGRGAWPGPSDPTDPLPYPVPADPTRLP